MKLKFLSYQTQHSIFTLQMNSHIWADEVAGQKWDSYAQISWKKKNDVKVQRRKVR